MKVELSPEDISNIMHSLAYAWLKSSKNNEDKYYKTWEKFKTLKTVCELNYIKETSNSHVTPDDYYNAMNKEKSIQLKIIDEIK